MTAFSAPFSLRCENEMDLRNQAYTSEDGETIVEKVPIGNAPESVTVDGKVFEMGFGAPVVTKCDLWPKESPFLSCTPQEVDEFREEHKKHNIAIEYRDDGTAVVGSKPEFEKAAKFRGYGVC